MTTNIYDMADTWNDSGTDFTAIKMDVTNTASGSGSKLIDLLVGGSSKFAVDPNGDMNTRKIGLGNQTTYMWDQTGATTRYTRPGVTTSAFQVTIGGVITTVSTGYYGFSSLSSNAGASVDVRLYRDGNGQLAQRNGTTSQIYCLYNTFTDSSNYERFRMGWSSNRLVLDTEEGGTGTARGMTIGGADLILSSLPTSDPTEAGQLWNDSGTLKISAG